MGYTPQSYLYRNDGEGHFTDVTQAMNPEIGKAGMVTGAVWADINGDKNKELIITGEWMSTRIFSYNKSSNKFEELKNTNLKTIKWVVADGNGGRYKWGWKSGFDTGEYRRELLSDAWIEKSR